MTATTTPSTFDAQLALWTGVAQAALSAHGLPQANVALCGYAENVTFRVDAPGATFALRLYRPGRFTPREVRSELEWLHALRTGTDELIPGPVPYPDGALVRSFVSDEGVSYACALFEWVDGAFVGEAPDEASLRAVGRLMAGLHVHSASFEPSAEFSRPTLDFGEFAAFLDGLPRFTGEQRELLRRGLRVTTEALARAGRPHLVHADLHQGNFLLRDGRAVAIDFDDCLFAPFAYDIATTLVHLRHLERYAELRDAFLDAYREVRPLEAAELASVERFMVARRVWLVRWILERHDQPGVRDWADDYLVTHLRGLQEDLGRLS